MEESHGLAPASETDLPSCRLSAEQFEQKNVLEVYDKIADHFDTTRYKPWPIVDQFLTSLSSGTFGMDVGCGNGKYFKVNSTISIVGCDTCEKLIRIANDKSPFTLLSNALSLPITSGKFDFVISIAVIHHLSTENRRIMVIKEMERMLRVGGKCLIFVWAFEQQSSRRKFIEQDVQVSWRHKETDQIHYRYYHLFKQNELEELVNKATCKFKIIKAGYDRDNWYVELEKI